MRNRDREIIFGKLVRQARKLKRLTQTELAKESGLAIDTIGRIERGMFSPSIDTVSKILEVVEIPYTLGVPFNAERQQTVLLVNMLPRTMLPVLNTVLQILIEKK